MNLHFHRNVRHIWYTINDTWKVSDPRCGEHTPPKRHTHFEGALDLLKCIKHKWNQLIFGIF